MPRWKVLGAAFLVVAALQIVVAGRGAADQSPHPTPAASSDAGDIRPPLNWIRLQAGRFTMGRSDGPQDERPQREVRIKAFEMMENEVTVAEYRRCVDGGVCEPPPGRYELLYWDPPANNRPMCNWGIPERAEHPMNCVMWIQADKFCKWHSARLPSEAEWEYAATSRGTRQRYPWGADKPSCNYAVMLEGSIGCGQIENAPVCTKPAGHTKEGLCDMAGNVEEWVEDRYHNTYTGAPKDGRAWTEMLNVVKGMLIMPQVTGVTRVLRGGHLRSLDDELRTTTRREHFEADSMAHGEFGFRCTRVAVAVPKRK